MDVQVRPVEQPPATQSFELPDSLGLTLQEGFELDIDLDVTHEVVITVGSERIRATGAGGEALASGIVYLERGQEYPVVERYAYEATVVSRFIEASFTIDAEIMWTLVPEASGRFEYVAQGVPRDLTARFDGDVTGENHVPQVGRSIDLRLSTTRDLPPGDTIVYEGSFAGLLDRTATVAFGGAQLPPWDIDGDGVTNITDLVRAALNFGRIGVGLAGDVDGNGRIDIRDLVLIGLHFGQSFVLAAPTRASSGRAVAAWLRKAVVGDGVTRVDVVMDPRVVLGGVDVAIAYDGTRWAPVSAQPGPGLPHALSVSVPRTPGLSRVVAVSVPAANRAGDGPIASFAFRPTAPHPRSGFRLARLNLADGEGHLIATTLVRDTVPATNAPLGDGAVVQIGPNYPNPLNPDTWVPLRLRAASDVVIDVFSADGALVRRLDLGRLAAGDYTTRGRAAHWDGRNSHGERVSTGVYLYRLSTSAPTLTRRMLVAK